MHRGPAVSGIEARGEVSHVGERQREQMAAREERRQAVLEEARELERAAQCGGAGGRPGAAGARAAGGGSAPGRSGGA